MRRNVYILGNPLIEHDALPFKLFPKLKKELPDFNFIHFDPTEEVPLGKTKEFILIDTVMGLQKVTIINDLDHFILSPRVSPHDYDLPLELGILQKLKKIKRIKIIGLPQNIKMEEALKQIKLILNSLSHPAEFKKM